MNPDGEILRLLVSGVESPPHVFQGCPDGMQLHHDDLFNPFTGEQINEGLNKDNTSQGFYDEAVYMAIRWTPPRVVPDCSTSFITTRSSAPRPRRSSSDSASRQGRRRTPQRRLPRRRRRPSR